jgi:hypothetical protein
MLEIVLALSIPPEHDGPMEKVLFPKRLPQELQLRAEYNVRNRPHKQEMKEKPITFLPKQPIAPQ